MIRVIISAALLSLSMACATGASSGVQTAVAVAQPLKAPVAALASKVGVNESYVTLALDTAQALVGQGKDQPTAAKQGVERAAAKASADGVPMSSAQQSSLLEGLSGLLTAK